MPVAAKNAVVIVNPRSGLPFRRRQPGEIASVLSEAGVNNSVAIIAQHENIAEIARNAVKHGADVVIACGGDGTVSAVASAVVGSQTALGVIPLGTLNHFAKDLHIPFDLAAAARIISQAKTDSLDVGEVNGHIFVNNSSIGIYPAIVIGRERRRRTGRSKPVAFLQATLQALRRYPFLDVRIDAKGDRTTQRTPFVFAGNNEYEIKGLHIGSRHSLNQGRLYLYVAAPVSRLGLLGIALAALLGVIDKTKSLQMFGVPEAFIETPQRVIAVSADGEVLRLRTPLHYVLRPRALKTIVP